MFSALRKLASKFFAAIGKEAGVLEELHGDVQATLERMETRDPGLTELLSTAHGYAVFPSVGKATAIIGGAFGKGEVFERGKLIGYAGLGQLTLGVQLGPPASRRSSMSSARTRRCASELRNWNRA